MRNVKALIIGPHETPYEFGFFEVLPPEPGQEKELGLANTSVVFVQIQQGYVTPGAKFLSCLQHFQDSEC